MAILTKEEIKKRDDVKRELVKVPEWGGEVYVKRLSGSERDWLESKIYQTSQEKGYITDVRSALVAMATVDKAGNQLFSEEDVDWLGEKSALALDRIADVARRLSGMAVGALGEAEKNLGEGQTEGLASD
jgi:hypothetical protein